MPFHFCARTMRSDNAAICRFGETKTSTSFPLLYICIWIVGKFSSPSFPTIETLNRLLSTRKLLDALNCITRRFVLTLCFNYSIWFMGVCWWWPIVWRLNLCDWLIYWEANGFDNLVGAVSGLRHNSVNLFVCICLKINLNQFWLLRLDIKFNHKIIFKPNWPVTNHSADPALCHLRSLTSQPTIEKKFSGD